MSQELGTGIGVQLESILSYLITDQFSVGVGGRYWAMWTTKDAISDIVGTHLSLSDAPAKTERYGVFVQLDYKGIGSPSDGFEERFPGAREIVTVLPVHTPAGNVRFQATPDMMGDWR